MKKENTNSIKESDLFLPISEYFKKNGYTVKSEVKDCDIVAVKDDETIIIELKTSFNLKLVYQAIERQKLSDNVYVAIPRFKNSKEKSFKNCVSLIKRLDLGLITVGMDTPLKFVEIINYPKASSVRKNKTKIKKLENEFQKRKIDKNIGGVNKTKIITVYRENCLKLVALFDIYGTLSLSDIKKYELTDNVSSILRQNYYKWFSKVEKGTYTLSETGKMTLDNDMYLEIINYYKNLFLNS